MELLNCLKADWQSMTLTIKIPSFKDLFWLYLCSYGFRVIVRMRLAFLLSSKKGTLRIRNIISVLLYWMNLRRGVDISRRAIIGEGLRLPHPVGIVIGVDVRIGKRLHILQNTTIGGTGGKVREFGSEKQTMPWLGDYILIGAGAVLLGPIRIGNHAQIGANAVVLHDVNDETIALGVPAQNRKVEGMRTTLAELQQHIEFQA